MAKNNLGGGEMLITDAESLRDRIHIIRGQRVMMDYDLAEIYGCTTKVFNQQVKNNTEKFDEDFRSQINKLELNGLVGSKILTSRQDNLFSGQDGSIRCLPYAFTEQRIYMLMTVLKGDLATRQSRG